MILMERDHPAIEQECREAVDRLLARHGWQLLEHAVFVQRTSDHLNAGVATDAHRCAVNTYCQALYQACSGVEGSERQELAYTELFHYLYDCAHRYCPDVCDDATQRALEHTFTGFDRCRYAGAFLAFALQRLMDAARALRREEKSWGGDEPHVEAASTWQVDPVEVVLSRERRTRLQHFADEFLRQHPRAAQQFAALWLKYVEDLDEAAISRKLGKPIRSVYVLRARAIEKLRAEPRWREFAAEWGIISSDSSIPGVPEGRS